MNPQKFSPLKPKTVLAVAAHADDIDSGAGGTVAKFAHDGAEVHYLIITDGCKGTNDNNMTPEKLRHTRQEEQRAALNVLGGKEASFLGYCDGELEVTMELKNKIVKAIRTVRPDVVITFDPSMIYSEKLGYINHPDHRAAGQATLDAVFPLARDRLSFPEHSETGIEPHVTPTVLLVNFDKSNFAVDITDTLDKKIEALSQHVSQSTMPPEFFRDHAIEDGRQYGLELAEAFVRIDLE